MDLKNQLVAFQGVEPVRDYLTRMAQTYKANIIKKPNIKKFKKLTMIFLSMLMPHRQERLLNLPCKALR
jgi:hypothetical protein